VPPPTEKLTSEGDVVSQGQRNAGGTEFSIRPVVMVMNSCQKGKRGERAWRDELVAHGYDARRGRQFSGSPDSPDVICHQLSGFHFEVKAVERLNVNEAMAQAIDDAGDKIPVVAHKRNRSEWLVTMRASDWFKMLAKVRPAQDGD
jgi:hypothetical protein